MSLPNEPSATDVALLLDRWDLMSEHFLPGRTELLARATQWLRTADAAPLILELGSGPGTNLRMLSRKLPHARVLGIDNDPVLRRLHFIATPASDPISLIDANLSDRGWVRVVPPDARPGAILAVQVLHYFAAPRFAEILAEIRGLLGPRGVLIHIDHVPAAGGAKKQPSVETAPFPAMGGVDPWTRWWNEAAQAPSLAGAFGERSIDDGSPDGSAEYHPAQEVLERHLRTAGLGDIVMQQRNESSLLTIARAESVGAR